MIGEQFRRMPTVEQVLDSVASSRAQLTPAATPAA